MTRKYASSLCISGIACGSCRTHPEFRTRHHLPEVCDNAKVRIDVDHCLTCPSDTCELKALPDCKRAARLAAGFPCGRITP